MVMTMMMGVILIQHVLKLYINFRKLWPKPHNNTDELRNDSPFKNVANLIYIGRNIGRRRSRGASTLLIIIKYAPWFEWGKV